MKLTKKDNGKYEVTINGLVFGEYTDRTKFNHKLNSLRQSFASHASLANVDGEELENFLKEKIKVVVAAVVSSCFEAGWDIGTINDCAKEYGYCLIN